MTVTTRPGIGIVRFKNKSSQVTFKRTVLGSLFFLLSAVSPTLAQQPKSSSPEKQLKANSTALRATQSKQIQPQILGAKKADVPRGWLDQIVLGISGGVGATTCLLMFWFWYGKTESRKLADQCLRNSRLQQVVRDQTSELQATLEEQAALMQLVERKRRMESVGLLAAGVAHDLNNHLQVIASSNAVLGVMNAPQEVRTDALRRSNTTLKHASQVLSNLFQYSRQQGLATEDVSFSDYLRGTRPIFQSAIQDHARLTIFDRSNGSVIRVEASLLTTAVLNLLSNAVESMPDGGDIELTADEHLVADDLASLVLRPGEYLRLRIRDTGCGMSETQCNQAKAPFFSTKPDNEQVTGLGLSSVAGFVRESDGELQIESEEGVGTTVSIFLPRARVRSRSKTNDNTDTKTSPKLTSQHSPSDCTALVVEDNEFLAPTLLRLLRYKGIDAEHVVSAEEAQQRLSRDNNYTFVLADVQLTGTMDGSMLAEWVDKLPAGPPVLLMSGYESMSEETERSILSKPFSGNELDDFLAKNLGVQSLKNPVA